MKKYLVFFALMISFCLSIALLTTNTEVSAGMEYGLTDNEKMRLFGQTRKLFENLKEIIKHLKKVNIRLTNIETSDIENLKQTHAEILTQVETLQKLIPGIQGTVELGQSGLTRRLSGLSTVQIETRELLPAIVGVQEKNFKTINQRIDGLDSGLMQVNSSLNKILEEQQATNRKIALLEEKLGKSSN